jgi:carboxymethylenebutenolidase
MPNIEIETTRGNLPAYFAQPLGGRPWPGVVVIHDVVGMGSDLRTHADWFARSGYLAVAPNLFHWAGRFTCIRTVIKELIARNGRSFDEVEATRLWLKNNPACTGRIGVIGFCMGGGFALLLAPSGDYDASAPNYGRVPQDADTLLAGACPVVASFGRKDRGLRGAAAKLERALTVNDVPHDVKEYADAGHAFLNAHQANEVPLPFRVLMRIMGVGYHGPSADDARRRIAAFFDAHLRGHGGAR